ncbi:MAG: DNA double-strand break repair nuclease NurA [Dehalococcoidales bacterium]|nr:MAG: DNA double-strand break repair nuclease NurA [Dehalococcoidales bacterium]
MSLDLTKVASQVGGLLARLKEGLSERNEHLRNALETAHAQAENLDSLKKKIAASKTTWLLADLTDGLDLHIEPTQLPTDFSVIATDGSHIDVDRHRAARCFLINIGSVVLNYGTNPDALLDSFPDLYVSEDELVISHPETNREQPIEGTLLGIKRSVDECRRLVDLAADQPAGSSTVALVDGTLILWGLEGYPEFVSEQLLDEGFLYCLNRLREQNGDKKVALASYISLPRGTDVVNTLKVALCPNNPLDTDKHCKECRTRDCNAVSGIRDRELFAGILGDGERSALFKTTSRIVEKQYGEHRIYFYYINVDEEIARVEIPEWVVKDEELVALTQSLILDQCRRGHGYPVALSEAHERAVVTGADRENFWQLVETALADEKIQTFTSAKARSKNTRWI